MPTPKSGETEKDYLKHCIPQLIHEGYEQRVAVAICYSKYRKEGTGKKSPKPKQKDYSSENPREHPRNNADNYANEYQNKSTRKLSKKELVNLLFLY